MWRDKLWATVQYAASSTTEINPFLQTWVYDDRFVWLKLIGALVVTLILWDIYRRAISKNKLKPLLIILYILVSFYTVIVLWNLLVLFTSSVAAG